jgi:hypothetical protein
MVHISESDEPVKVPLVYYDQYGERHEVGSAAVQIKDGEVIAVGKIVEDVEHDAIIREILGGINLEAFSISHVSSQKLYSIPAPDPTPYLVDSPADEARRRLSPLGMEKREHVTAKNPNGEVRQCERKYLHGPHEWQAEFGAYFDVYCPGINTETRGDNG